MSETDISLAIRKALNATRLAYVWREQAGTSSSGRRQLAPPGTPDIIGWIRTGPNRGKMLGIEVKTPKGKARPAQLEWHANAMADGVVCGFARSVDEAIAIVRG